jgi:two-component system chemotaxis sensor kinase CheA
MPRAHNSFVDGGGDGSCIRLLDEVIQGHVSAARLSQHVAGLAAGGPREAVRAAEQLDALVAFADLPWDADTQAMLRMAAQVLDEALRADGRAPIVLLQDAESRELLADVLSESDDGLATADELLLDAEGLDRAGIDALFRVFHTLKGTAAFVGLLDVETVAHAAEDLMAVVRDGDAALGAEVVEVLCDAVRLVRQILASASHAAHTHSPLARPAEVTPMLTRLGAARATEVTRLAACPRPLVARADLGRAAAASTATPASTSTLDPLRSRASSLGARLGSVTASTPSMDQAALKVDRERLARVMDVVGELVILEALIAHVGNELPAVPPSVVGQLRQLHKVTRELARAALTLRAAPLAGLLRKLPRRARDTAQRQGGRAVRVVGEGPTVELDRELVERLEGPLLEALDAVVVAGVRGGSTTIEVVVRVESRGSRVVLTLSVAMGSLVEDALHDAQRVVEAMRGRMTTTSSPPEVVVELPRTLALLDALIVRVGAESFAVASSSVLALRPLEGAAVGTRLGRGRRVEHRGRWIPLWSLGELLSVPPAPLRGPEVLVVLEAGGQPLGVVVEEARSTQISVKSLDGPLLEGSSFLGATVLGEGTLALVLSVDDLARRAAAREALELDVRT